jgi:hypothetical protein
MEDEDKLIGAVKSLFNQAIDTSEMVANVADGGIQFAEDEVRRGLARAAFAELLENEPGKWQFYWFFFEPTYLRLFRFEEVFAQGEHQRWLYLMYLQFCKDYPDFAPVTAVAHLDDIL